MMKNKKITQEIRLRTNTITYKIIQQLGSKKLPILNIIHSICLHHIELLSLVLLSFLIVLSKAQYCSSSVFLILNRYMKGRNQFDYPTASATNYKAYRAEEDSLSDKKALYHRVLRQESHSERERAKHEQQRRTQAEAQQQQQRLREELERKRNELLELERRRQEALENERRAQEQAALKAQQDKVRRIEQEQRAKQQNEEANHRFREALRRLDAERQELNLPERQAQQRRRAAQEGERQERQQATQYAAYLREREEAERLRTEEEQRAGEEAFRTGLLRHGGGRSIDYSKTCFHNPHLVFRNEEGEGESAVERGEREERRRRELSAERRERQAEARRRSLERGQKAKERTEAEREYRAYSEEAERQQREYNLRRIEAGKQDQLTGLKPLTLQQLELNKRKRGEEDFEQLFLGGQEAPSSDFASKYAILEAKYAPPPQQNLSRTITNSQQEASLPPYHGLLEGREEEEIQQRDTPSPMVVEKRPMAETRADDLHRNYPREDLSYSESEDD